MPETLAHDEAEPLMEKPGGGGEVSGSHDPPKAATETNAPTTGEADVSDDEAQVGKLLTEDAEKGTGLYFSSLTYLKCIVLTLVSTYPFFGVVQTLSVLKPQEFEPCTHKPCNYVRLFKDANFPGTGTRVIQVQNGYEPIYLSNVHELSDNLRLTVAGAAEATPFDKLPKKTQELITNETYVLGNLTRPHKVGLFMSHWTHRILASPVLALSGRLKKPNFTAIPSGVCDKSYEKTIELCQDPETINLIQNTLPKGVAKDLYIVCVWSWALFKILHDCFLMSSNDVALRKWKLKPYAMPFGILSCWMQLFAAGIGFFWSAGAVAVFVAKRDSCTCFYRLPEFEALLGVATPLYLLFLGLGKVDSLALSFAYGDYLYFQTYDVPFRVVRRSHFWYTASLVSEKVGGNVMISKESGDSQALETIKEGRVIQSRLLQGLITVFPFMFLAPASCGITLRVLEWLQSLGSSDILAPEMKAVFFCVMWVPFVLTALFAFALVLDWVPGFCKGWMYVARMLRAFFVKVYGVQWMYLYQRVLDPRGRKLNEMKPEHISDCAKYLSGLTQLIVFPLCVYLFLCYVFSFLPVAYVGAALCLIPTAVTAGYPNSLVQAELWAAGGFVFVFSLWFVLAALLVPDVVEIEPKLIDQKKDVVLMDEDEVRADLEKGSLKCLAHCLTKESPKVESSIDPKPDQSIREAHRCAAEAPAQ